MTRKGKWNGKARRRRAERWAKAFSAGVPMMRVRHGQEARDQAKAWDFEQADRVVRTEEAESRRCRWVYLDDGSGWCITCGEVDVKLED
jgi:thiol:disulfide interchange protein